MKKLDKNCGLTYEYGSFERQMRNKAKKRKNIEDQIILDAMLEELKKKHQISKQQQIDDLTQKLEKAKG